MISLPGIQAVADHGALYAAIGQRRLAERLDAELGDRRWDADLPTGRLWFTSEADPSHRITARAQFIATIAPGARSLLWGWAHPNATERAAAEHLRGMGAQHGLAELTTAEVPFDTTAEGAELEDEITQLGHLVAAAAVEGTGVTPYYTAPSGGGSRIVFLLEDIDLRPVDLALDGAGLLSALMESVAVDKRAALQGFARHSSFGLTSTGDTDEITDGRSRVTAHWDAAGRLANLDLQLAGAGT